MKQVFNWTIGSFFRTIGRTIAFLVMGGLIYYILTTNGFEFGIKDLFFDKVSASQTYANGWLDYYDTSGNEYPLLDRGGWMYRGTTVTTPSTAPAGGITTGYLQFYFKNTHDNNDYVTINQKTSSITLFSYLDYNTDNFEYVMTSDGRLYVGKDNIGSVTLRLYFPGSNQMTQCSNNGYYNRTIEWTCYMPTNFNGRITRAVLAYDMNYPGYGYSANYFGNSITFGLSNNTRATFYENVEGAIQDQTQQQQQQHEEMMDDNTTQAESEATDFFEDFDAPDIGGLGAIITAPLNTIRSLLNSSCTNLVLPLPFVNKNITLPCMNSIYTEHFGAFFTIYQTIILAIIAYRCIRSIFFDIHGFTNPNDDRIEVMDL